MSIDLHLDQKIKRRKLEQIDQLIELLGELEPSKKTHPMQVEHFEGVSAFLEAEKARIESGSL